MKYTQPLALTIIINFTTEKGWYHARGIDPPNGVKSICNIRFIQQFLISTQPIFFYVLPQLVPGSAAEWYILLIFNNVYI